jgi:chromosome segregation ATPase
MPNLRRGGEEAKYPPKIIMARSDFERMSEELAEAKATITSFQLVRDTDRAMHQNEIKRLESELDEIKTDREALIKSFNERFAFKEKQIEDLMAQLEEARAYKQTIKEEAYAIQRKNHELADDNQKLKVQLVIANELLERVKDAFIECDAHLLYKLDGREIAWQDFSKFCAMEADTYRIAAGAALLKVMK